MVLQVSKVIVDHIHRLHNTREKHYIIFHSIYIVTKSMKALDFPLSILLIFVSLGNTMHKSIEFFSVSAGVDEISVSVRVAGSLFISVLSLFGI